MNNNVGHITEVAVAIFLKPDDTFLLSSRPTGKPYAGFWEFPGGKIETGETVRAALVRELLEELNVTITHATPWFSFIMHYTHATVRLHCWRVSQWHGEMRGMEGQQFQWQTLAALSVSPTLPGCAPIFKALALPLIYSHATLSSDTLQLSTAQLAAMTKRPDFNIVGVTVNTRQEIERAAELKCDFAILPLTDSSPFAWQIFTELTTATPLPCYATGAIGKEDLSLAFAHGAHGIALADKL